MNDGGKAFPRPGFTAEQTESQEGMSLRDWFAGQALSGLIASYSGPDCQIPISEKAARIAYDFADAMLAERSKCQSS